MAPSTPADAKGLLKTSIRDDDPVVFIEHSSLYNVTGMVPEEESLTPIGKARVAREGRDVTVITYGIVLHDALKAADTLKKEGTEVEVIDIRSLKPLDMDLVLESVKKTGRVVLPYEGPKTGGVGAEIAALITEHAFDYLDGPIIRVAGPDTPQPANEILLTAISMDSKNIVDGVKRAMG